MGFNNKKYKDSEGDSTEDWLTTYSDLVTLLLAFFVLLFSFSEIDAKKWEELVQAFAGDFSITESPATDSLMENNTSILDQNIDIRMQLMEIRQRKQDDKESATESEEELEEETPEEDLEEEIPEEEIPEEETQQEIEYETEGDELDQEIIDERFEELYSELIKYNDIEGLELEIVRTDSEIRIRLSNNLLFSPEQADIYENSTSTLREIVGIIKSNDEALNMIVMEGNTDNLPITTGRYRDNFELSIERALNVLYFFRYEGDFQPNKLVPMGYGEYNPVATNDTDVGRAKNRRTDILLIKSTSSN